MSSNRLIYDTCAYKKDIDQSGILSCYSIPLNMKIVPIQMN